MTRAPVRYTLRRVRFPRQEPAPHPLGPWARGLATFVIFAGFWLAMNVIARL